MKRAMLLCFPIVAWIISLNLLSCEGGGSGGSGHPSAGTLDKSFGTEGKVITAIGTPEYPVALAIQSNGKLVTAGTTFTTAYEFALVRYNTDGSLDTTFNTTGIVTTDSGTFSGYASALAIQSDGKLVAAGTSGGEFALVRYNTDGSLDTTFNTTGIVTTDIGPFGDHATALAIQSDGKLVAAGYKVNLGTADEFALVRYNTDGSLDTTFNTTGIVTTAIGTIGDYAHALAIQSDGKLVAAGTSGGEFALVRYNTDGSLDTTFNITGMVTTAIGTSSSDGAYALAIQSDGKLVAAGNSYNGTADEFALVRYNTDGSLDTTFNTTGKVTTAIGTFEYANALAVQSDGKLVAAGYSGIGTQADFALVRYNTDGSLDTTFNTTGKVTTAIGTARDVATALAIQSDGKLVAAGYTFKDNVGVVDEFALVRYCP